MINKIPELVQSKVADRAILIVLIASLSIYGIGWHQTVTITNMLLLATTLFGSLQFTKNNIYREEYSFHIMPTKPGEHDALRVFASVFMWLLLAFVVFYLIPLGDQSA